MRPSVRSGHFHPLHADHATLLADEERADEASIDDLANAPGQRLPWTGVRNYQARNFMRDHMQRRRRRAVLSLVVRRARRGRVGRGVQRRRTPTPRSSTARASTSTPSPRARSRAGCKWMSSSGKQDAPAAACARCASGPRWPTCACCARATGCPSRRSSRARVARRAGPAAGLSRAHLDLLVRAAAGGRAAGARRRGRLPGRPAGRGRRHDDGAVPDLDPVAPRRRPALAVKMAIATSMATIIFTSMSSLRAHHARGAVRWDRARAWRPASWPAVCLPGPALSRWSRARGWRSSSPCSSASRRHADAAQAQRRRHAHVAWAMGAERGRRWASAFCRRWSARAAPSCRCRS